MAEFSWTLALESNLANPYTVTSLLESLKRRGMIPSAAGSMTTADFLAIANEELQSYMLDILQDVGEEHLVAKDPVDYAITSGQAEYAVPERSIDGIVRTVTYSSDNVSFTPFSRTEPGRVFAASGSPQAYTVEGSNLVLVPTPDATSGTLRVKYLIRPNRLVETSAAGEVLSIDTGTKTVTMTAALPGTFTASRLYDLVKGYPHFGSHSIDATVSSAGASSLTFTDALPAGLAVGDFVCLAGESPVPQIPVSLHHVLALRVVGVYLFGIGEYAAAEATENLCEKKRLEAVKRMSPRTIGSPRCVINRYGPGMRK